MTHIRTLALAATILASTPAVAATTRYDSRAALNASGAALVTETFEGCGAATALGSGQTLSASGGTCAITAGVTISPDDGYSLYIAAAGHSGNSTSALGVNYPTSGHMMFEFETGVTAFGFDLFQNYGGGYQSGAAALFTIDVFGEAGLLQSFVTDVASYTGSFFGLTSTDAITKVTVRQNAGFAVIDNLAFGSATALLRPPATEDAALAPVAVPEPAALALFGLGLIGLAGLRRRV